MKIIQIQLRVGYMPSYFATTQRLGAFTDCSPNRPSVRLRFCQPGAWLLIYVIKGFATYNSRYLNNDDDVIRLMDSEYGAPHRENRLRDRRLVDRDWQKESFPHVEIQVLI